MKYEKILSSIRRNSSCHKQKNMGFGAFTACCFLITFFLFAVFKPYGGPLPIVNLEQSISVGLQMLMSSNEVSEPQQTYTNAGSATNPSLHNYTNSKSQSFEMNGDIRVHGNSSTIFIASTQQHITTIPPFTAIPYARRTDRAAMRKVKNFTILHQTLDNLPRCTRNLTNIPAIVFSTGGHSGNQYHDFSDLLIPLYLTANPFNRKVIFLLADKGSWWTSKYKMILENLSEQEIIDIDKEDEVLCFSRMIVGLKAHKEFGIDPLQGPPRYSTPDFTKFLRDTYSLDRERVKTNDCKRARRPRLLIISRKKTRHLTNEEEVAKMARMMGFEVVVREMGWQVSLVSRFVNSFDVMIGVHGAGITNMVYLPEKAVVIQIVPIGLEALAKMYFEIPVKDMRLRYLEYKVGFNESSLFGRYSVDSEVYRNPGAVSGKGWHAFRSIYLDSQDVNLDLGRFRGTLVEAFELLCS